MAVSTLRAVATSEGIVIAALRMGKYKQLFLMIGVGGLMLNCKVLFAHSLHAGMLMLYIATFSSYVSFAEYVLNYMKALKRTSPSE